MNQAHPMGTETPRSTHFQYKWPSTQTSTRSGDFKSEPEHILKRYGPDAGKRGTFANNCLTARRLLNAGPAFNSCIPDGTSTATFSPSSNNNASIPTPHPPHSRLEGSGLLEAPSLFGEANSDAPLVNTAPATPSHWTRHFGRAYIGSWRGGIKPDRPTETDDSDGTSPRIRHVHDMDTIFIFAESTTPS